MTAGVIALLTAIVTVIGTVVTWWLGGERRDELERKRRVAEADAANKRANEMAEAVARGDLSTVERLQRERDMRVSNDGGGGQTA